MTCCNKKAIVKFKSYKKGGFRYRLTSSSPWQEINSQENLNAFCEDAVSYIPGQQIVFYYKTERDGLISEEIFYLGFFNSWITPVGYEIKNSGSYYSEINATGKDAAGVETTTGSIHSYSGYVVVGWGTHPSLIPDFKFKFTVKGAETGTEYLVLENLDQCPEWQQEGCQLQEEQSFEIELYSIDLSFIKKIPGFSALPLPTVMSECVFAQSGVPLTCDDDDKDKECPPETDCEIECNGFKCCYHKGKAIKVIPL